MFNYSHEPKVCLVKGGLLSNICVSIGLSRNRRCLYLMHIIKRVSHKSYVITKDLIFLKQGSHTL